jgi:SAM-dependent methyltransferase
MNRLHSEQVFHDRQAEGRREALGDLVFSDDAYLDHESWIRPAFDRLGDVAGRQVLDFGCGHGMAAVVLARRGARVTAFDLSPGYLAEARARAAANRVTVDFAQADGERLPFADASFDRVWGNAVLHHLDPGRAGGELRRVLRPGGAAVFCEPWGENPLLNWARRRLPYPGKKRTPEEEPLRMRQVRELRRYFPEMVTQGHQLLSMVRRVARRPRLIRVLECGDEVLLRRVSGLWRWCRYVVLAMSKPGDV